MGLFSNRLRVALLIIAVALVVIIGVVAGVRFLGVPPPEEPPNILVLLIDALRPERLSDYGHFRDTNPFLAEFGKRGVRFAKAYSHSSHTKISISSLFTGLIPPEHKVRVAASPGGENKDKILSDVLSSDVDTLAEVLSNRGYLTAAFITNPHLRAFLGFSQGFDEYKYFDLNTSAEKINQQVIACLRKHQRMPFFLYIHYMDVHVPYNPPTKYRHFYTEKKNLRPIEINGPLRFKIADELIEYTKAVYDAQINYWDDCFREFIKNLEENGWLNNTLIIILADHGEEFYEHGGFGHGFTLYEEELHIPLYMVLDGYIPADKVRNDRVKVIDLFPTICYFAGADVRNLNLQGTNLFSSRRKKGDSEQIIYAETYRGKVPRSAQTEAHKIIYNSKLKNFEFYDLIQDTRENNNIYLEGDPVVEKLKIELFDILALGEKGLKTERKELDPETIKRLRDLGYLR
jgi:arylsulfatase A-like enzyme